MRFLLTIRFGDLGRQSGLDTCTLCKIGNVIAHLEDSSREECVS